MDAASPGYRANKVAHLKRLRRIEGRLRGLQRMVEARTPPWAIGGLTSALRHA